MDKRSMLNKDYYYAGYSYADYQLPMNQAQVQGSYYQFQPQGQVLADQQAEFQGRPILPIYESENAVKVISNSDSANEGKVESLDTFENGLKLRNDIGLN